MHTIYAETVVSVDELKRDTASVLERSESEPVAIFDHDQPAAYLISAELYESLLDTLDDLALGDLVKQRQGRERIRVSIDDL